MTRQLRPEAGGDPTSGPVRELANQPPSPRAAEDFPDAPEPASRAGAHGDLSPEQLDDFAARLGLTDESDAAAPDRAGSVGSGRAAGSAWGPESDEAPGPAPEPTGPTVRVRRVAGASMRGLRRRAARVLVVVGRATVTAGHRLRTVGERLTEPASTESA